jgi:cbb3-type cytochrome oxidase subunit 3
VAGVTWVAVTLAVVLVAVLVVAFRRNEKRRD